MDGMGDLTARAPCHGGAVMSNTGEIPIPERYVDAAARPEAESTLRERLPAKLRKIADARLVALAKEAFGYATHPAISKKHKAWPPRGCCTCSHPSTRWPTGSRSPAMWTMPPF